MQQSRILVADDDREIVNLVSDCLEEEGFKVHKAYNGLQALDMLDKEKFSLLILDIMMPEIDGIEICRQIRGIYDIPILFLSAKTREIDKVIGLEIGADDYITKPFSVNELVARVKAHLRREKRKTKVVPAGDVIIEFDNIKIDTESYEVLREEEKVDLSTKEFQILMYLIKNNNIVLSRDQIYEGVWNENMYGDINTVTVHITNLRKKFDIEGKYIKTVWGAGYKMTLPA